MRNKSFALALCIAPLPAIAQSTAADTLDVQQEHELTEIVVSEFNSRLQSDNVLNVEKLDLNNVSATGTSLAERLTAVAGVSNFSTGAGIGKPVIRGMSGNRIAVISQGVRLENQQWGDEHGLGLDANGFGHVEVIKGPASLLYGSDALGGVLYFGGERYAADNSGEGALHSEFNSNTNGWRNTGALKLSRNRFHCNAFGGYTTHQDYSDGRGNAVPNSRFRTADVKAVAAYTGEKYTNSLKYNYLREQYGLTETEEGAEDDAAPDVAPPSRRPELPFQGLTTHIVGSENTFYLSGESKLKVDVGYVFNNRKEFEDDAAQAALDMNLSTVSYNAKWYSSPVGRWAFVAGSAGMHQTNANSGEEMLVPDATTADIGAFGIANFYYGDKAYWQTGIRFDARSISSSEHGEPSNIPDAAPALDADEPDRYFPAFERAYTAVNFSTGVHQPLADGLSLRANVASGFRAPTMFELLSDGVHEGTNRYEIGNPELKTENSYQVDMSLIYNTLHTKLFVNPYCNYVRDYVGLHPTGEERDGAPVFCYEQHDACLYGGEAGFHFHPHPLDWLHLEGTYCTAIGQDLHGQRALPLMPAHKLNAVISASFVTKNAVEKFSLYVRNQYSFAQNRVAAYETTTPAYNLLGAGVAIEVRINKQRLRFNVAANNLLDAAYYDHLSRYKTDGVYNIGRNFNVGVSVPVEWEM